MGTRPATMWSRRDGGTLGWSRGGASSHHHCCRCRRRVCPAFRSFRASLRPGHRRLPRAASKASRTEWLVLRADYAVCTQNTHVFPAFPGRPGRRSFRNSPTKRFQGPIGPDERTHPPAAICFGTPLPFQHRNSRLVEERAILEFHLGTGARLRCIPRGGGQPSQPAAGHHQRERKKKGKSLSTCTPASEQLQPGGSVKSGALRCS
ncbi:hypothetical protein B0T18DRAFT_204659 [Schizothecium vesticola]|uniref:Uncharacterized protein n=1 Tax=Schizothecium vesticola TaxID=314040 RepID=A0AA40JYX4_9PEZI|nr:hypothetical protein B0T18DRAFT_204659 [Schizothecium vesticola]